MAERKPFLLRLDERTFLALKRWADDDLRSINAQVAFLLRRSLDKAGRLNREGPPPATEPPAEKGGKPEV